MRKAQLMLAAAVLLQAAPALASPPPVPVQNHPNEPVVTASGNKPTLEQVTEAALRGASARGWTAEKLADGQYRLRLVVRKHTVVALLWVSPERFSIAYESSDNMDFRMEDGVAYIHPKYNQWVRNLVQDIRKQLAVL